MIKHITSSRIWDLLATVITSACLLHCLGLPFIVALLPVATTFGENELVHLGLVLLAVPVTAWVVLSELGTKRHERFIAAACTGLSLMLAAVLIPALEPFETSITVVGGTLLASAHLWRWLQHNSRFPPAEEDV